MVKVNEVKEWGDWELHITSQTYQDGKEVTDLPFAADMGLQGMDDDTEYNNYLTTGDISEEYLARYGY